MLYFLAFWFLLNLTWYIFSLPTNCQTQLLYSTFTMNAVYINSLPLRLFSVHFPIILLMKPNCGVGLWSGTAVHRWWSHVLLHSAWRLLPIHTRDRNWSLQYRSVQRRHFQTGLLLRCYQPSRTRFARKQYFGMSRKRVKTLFVEIWENPLWPHKLLIRHRVFP